MTYQCTLQGCSMGAATITIDQVANKLWDKIVSPLKSVLGPFSGVITPFLNIAKPVLIQKLKSSVVDVAGVQADTAGTASYLVFEIAIAASEGFAGIPAVLPPGNEGPMEKNGIVWIMLFGGKEGENIKGGALYPIVLKAINDVVKEVTGIPPTEQQQTGPGWDTGTTGGTTGGSTGSTVVSAATVSELAGKVEAIAKQAAAQFLAVAKSRNDTPSYSALLSVVNAPTATLASKYFSKLSELLNNVKKNPNAAAGICSAASPVLAQITIPQNTGVAVQAKAAMIGMITPQLIAYSNSIISSGGFVIGNQPVVGTASSGGMSKTVLIAAAAGVAALILLSK